MATALPFLKFFPRDWLADPKLLLCSLAARGLWLEMLLMMHQNERRYGHLETAAGRPVTAAQLARAVRITEGEADTLLAELLAADVYSVGEDGVIYSRRLVREGEDREQASRAGKASAAGAKRSGGKFTARQRAANDPANGPPTTPPTERPTTRQPSDIRVQSTEEIQKTPSESCPEPAKAPASGQAVAAEPAVMTFPTVGPSREWSLTIAKLAEYRAAYPGADVEGELRKARQWLLDNPTRRKTAAGMPRFLGSWLGRANDRGRPATGPPAHLDRGAAAESRAFAQIAEALNR